MQGILETYEEMAASRMQKIRTDLLLAKNYYDGLADVSHEIGMDIVSVVGSDTVISAMVLLSSNSGMFGDLPERVLKVFYRNKDKSCDILSLRLGARLLKSTTRPQFPRLGSQRRMRSETLANVMSNSSYRQIKIFYGQFINIVRQDPTTRNLSGDLH
jgi:F0F1-type ATP synthase gamma subunit